MFLPLHDQNPLRVIPFQLVTFSIIVLCVVVFLYQQFLQGEQEQALLLSYGMLPAVLFDHQELAPELAVLPAELTLLSSMFLHVGWMHLIGNMAFLWVFGDNIEQKFGKIKYLGIYLIWGIAAGLIHIAGDPTSPIPAVGASGAISGILGAYLIIFPRARILTLMGYFMMHIQARWFLPFWLIVQNLLPYFMGGFGAASGGVAFLAHIGGFVVGLAIGYIYKKTHSSDSMYGTRYGYRQNY